jgi:uncharacterized repeat protein (TIGR01451 family)
MTNYRFIIITFVILLWFGFCSQAQAVKFSATGNPDDTASGEVITAYATAETLNYTDISGNPKTQVNPEGGDITVTVMPTYGFSYGANRTPRVGSDDGFGYIGQTRYMYLGITNEGDTSDTYILTFEAVYTGAGAGTWNCEIRRTADDSLIGTLIQFTNPSTYETVNVAEDATYFFYIKVTYPATGANLGDYLRTNVGLKTNSTPVGSYTGANGLTYGGIGSLGPAPIDWKMAIPVLTLTRTATTDVCTIPGYAGSVYAALPGSIITYRLVYSNTGNVSAESVILVDKIPPNTNLAHFNKTANTDYVNITMGQSNNTGGWTIWYSTQASPQKEYGNSTGWTMIGTLESVVFPTPPSNYFPGPPTHTTTATYSLAQPTPDPQASATWVKWERQYVDRNDTNRSITWGVTIR